MRVALIAPPFLPVPPRKYGGTDLFIAQLAEACGEGRRCRGVHDSEWTVGVGTRWFYKDAMADQSEVFDNLKDMTTRRGRFAMPARIATSSTCTMYLPSCLPGTCRTSRHTVHTSRSPMSEIYANFPD